MSKVTSGKLRKLVTLMLVVIGAFILLNKFVIEPRKQRAESKRLQQEAEEQKEEGGDKKIPIKVIDVIRHDFVDILDALGSVKGGMEIKLTFPIPGRIKAINYKEGEKIYFVLRNLDILQNLPLLSRFKEDWKKAGYEIEFFGLELDNEKLVPLKEFRRCFQQSRDL